MGMRHVYLPAPAERRLEEIAAERGSSVEMLIEIAAEEAALEFFRGRSRDPGKANLAMETRK